MIRPLAELWDSEAPKYKARALTLESCELRSDFLPRSGDRVLDAGCGAGAYLQLFGTLTQDLFGVDISPRMVEAARRFGKCEVGDVRKLPFPDASFTYVLSFLVINHCGDYRAALAEFNRVLRPGGRLVLVVPHRLSLMSLERDFMIRIGRYSLGECEHFSQTSLRRELRRAGLTPDESYIFSRRPENPSRIRLFFSRAAHAGDVALQRIFPRAWGECLAVRGVKRPSPDDGPPDS